LCFLKSAKSYEARYQQVPEIDETTLPPLDAMTDRLATKGARHIMVSANQSSKPCSASLDKSFGLGNFNFKVWNLLDNDGCYEGQAACFGQEGV